MYSAMMKMKKRRNKILEGAKEALEFAQGNRFGSRLHEFLASGDRKITEYDANSNPHSVYHTDRFSNGN